MARRAQPISTRLMLLFGLLLTLAGTPGDLQARPAEELEVRLLPSDANREPGRPFTTTLQVWLETEAAALRFTVEGFGIFAGHLERFERTGPFSGGSTQTVDTQVTATGAGAGSGELRFTVHVLEEDGSVRMGRRRDIHVLAESDRVWWSDSSPTDLQLQRVRELEGSAGPTSASRAVRRSALRARSQADPSQHPPRSSRRYAQDPTRSATGAHTVSGDVSWTDRNGGLHPVPHARVEIIDEDLIDDDVVAVTETNMLGHYSVTFDYDDGVGEGFPDLYAKAYARSAVADVRPDGEDVTYSIFTDPVQEVSGDLRLDLIAGNSLDPATAFSVHSALVMIGKYAATLADVMPSQIVTRFPTTRHTSLFDPNVPELHLRRLDRFDWDVIHHEYGHYFSSIHGLTDSPGGSHSFSMNLANVLGSKDKGLRLAWGEGWPTFFALAGQQRSGGATLGIFGVGDTAYQDGEDKDPPTNRDFETNAGYGEDNELSAGAMLWDLFDDREDGDDRVCVDDRSLFGTFSGAGVTTVAAAWEAIAQGKSNSEKAELAGAFSRNVIAPGPVFPPEDFNPADSPNPPKFSWYAHGGGEPNPLDEFSLVFYEGDFETEIERIDSIGDEFHQPTPATWGDIIGQGYVHWVVEGKNTSSPDTPGGALGKYWSVGRRIGSAGLILVIDSSGSMNEELAALMPLFLNAIEELGLAAGEAPLPTIQIITFKDDVQVRVTTTNPDEARAALFSISPNAGGTCPELGLQALQLAASNLTAGGTVIFASDASAHPGPSPDSIISEILAKGGTVYTVLSGSCPKGGGGSFAPTVRPEEVPITETVASKPGDGAGDGDEPPSGTIEDAGQEPLDDHGDTPAAATRLTTNGVGVRGMLHGTFSNPDVDYFVFPVEAGVPYRIRSVVHKGVANFILLDADGTTTRFVWFAGNPEQAPRPDVRDIPWVPTQSGDLYIEVLEAFENDAVYLIGIDPSPFGESFSDYASIAAATGGTAVFPDSFGVVDPELTRISLLAGFAGAAFPTVISSNPRVVPRRFLNNTQVGLAQTLILRGRRTHWSDGSTVSFSGGDIAVLATEVLDGQTIRVRIQPDPAAAPGPRDIEVSTPVEGGVEVAIGRESIEIGFNAFYQLLSFDPPRLARGRRATVVVEGAGFDWSPQAQIDLGSGIVVGAIRNLAPNRLEADVTVDANAVFGYRTVTVSDTEFADFSLARATIVYAPEPDDALLLFAMAASLSALAAARRRSAPRSPRPFCRRASRCARARSESAALRRRPQPLA